MNLEYPWDDERLKYKNIQLYKSKEKDVIYCSKLRGTF